MQRGDQIPGIKVFSQIPIVGEETFTRIAIQAAYYRDGEWDVFSGEDWYEDDDDSFFSSDAEDIFLALDEEDEGDVLSRRTDEGEDEEGRRNKIYMFANESDDEDPFGDDERKRRTIHMEDYL